MAIEIVGADRDDPGPKGVVLGFLAASDAGDEPAALDLLTANSKEGLSFNPESFPGGTATFGEVMEEAGEFIVPVTMSAEGEAQEMPFVVREEDGVLRLDLDRSMERMLGFSPQSLMEEMGGALAEGMGKVMEGVGEALAEGLSSIGGALAGGPDALEAPAGSEEPEVGEGPVEIAERHWVLPGGACPPEDLLDVGLRLGGLFRPPFAPPAEELDSEEWAAEGSRARTTRWGNEEQGFTVVESFAEMEGFASHSLSAAAYGLPDDRELNLVWVRSAVGESEPTVNISIGARGPETSLDAMEAWLAGGYGLET